MRISENAGMWVCGAIGVWLLITIGTAIAVGVHVGGWLGLGIGIATFFGMKILGVAIGLILAFFFGRD